MELSKQMNAMVLERIGRTLIYKQIPIPSPLQEQVLIKVMACGVCRTDLHILDGELNHPKLPLVPGHEVIGKIVRLGSRIKNRKVGEIVGVAWLGHTCGKCKYCRNGRENLCEKAKFTGYTIDGGYAEYIVAEEQYCYLLPQALQDFSKAPLLCAGMIGYRSYSMIPLKAKTIGLYGFGAAAHILTQVARHESKDVYAFTRDGDKITQEFAIKIGAVWSGGSSTCAPVKLDAAIIFAPAGELIPQALRNLDKGGILICGGIHMSDIPSFPYEILWEERMIRSVANLTRKDAEVFLAIASKMDMNVEATMYPLFKANEALTALREARIQGAAVLVT